MDGRVQSGTRCSTWCGIWSGCRNIARRVGDRNFHRLGSEVSGRGPGIGAKSKRLPGGAVQCARAWRRPSAVVGLGVGEAAVALQALVTAGPPVLWVWGPPPGVGNAPPAPVGGGPFL